MQGKSIFKLILIGDARVGKTTLRKSFMGEKFKDEYMVTLGADFAVKNFVMEEGDHKWVTLQIWDIAGQHRFEAIRDRYYSNSSGLLIVFDLTVKQSFDNIPRWINEYMENNNEKIIPMVLIGNKIDLLKDDHKQAVKDQEIQDYLKSLQSLESKGKQNFEISFIKTSAKTGENVETAFRKLAKKMIEFRYD